MMQIFEYSYCPPTSSFPAPFFLNALGVADTFPRGPFILIMLAKCIISLSHIKTRTKHLSQRLRLGCRLFGKAVRRSELYRERGGDIYTSLDFAIAAWAFFKLAP